MAPFRRPLVPQAHCIGQLKRVLQTVCQSILSQPLKALHKKPTCWPNSPDGRPHECGPCGHALPRHAIHRRGSERRAAGDGPGHHAGSHFADVAVSNGERKAFNLGLSRILAAECCVSNLLAVNDEVSRITRAFGEVVLSSSSAFPSLENSSGRDVAIDVLERRDPP